MTPTNLTIVVPVYNETRRLDAGLKALLHFLDHAGCAVDLLVVDDGSRDGTAERVAARLAGRADAALLRLPVNRGKGFAVKAGMLAARGKWRLFTDIDLSVPIEAAAEFLRVGEAGAEIVIGTRKTDDSLVTVAQPRYRKLLGEAFRQMTLRYFTPGLTDITCGFKMFRADVAQNLFSRSVINRWSFDAEILFLALRQGYTVREIPVVWTNNPETKVRLVVDLPRSMMELLRIRWLWARGGYGR